MKRFKSSLLLMFFLLTTGMGMRLQAADTCTNVGFGEACINQSEYIFTYFRNGGANETYSYKISEVQSSIRILVNNWMINHQLKSEIPSIQGIEIWMLKMPWGGKAALQVVVQFPKRIMHFHLQYEDPNLWAIFSSGPYEGMFINEDKASTNDIEAGLMEIQVPLNTPVDVFANYIYSLPTTFNIPIYDINLLSASGGVQYYFIRTTPFREKELLDAIKSDPSRPFSYSEAGLLYEIFLGFAEPEKKLTFTF
jgi:hypothetical protein